MGYHIFFALICIFLKTNRKLKRCTIVLDTMHPIVHLNIWIYHSNRSSMWFMYTHVICVIHIATRECNFIIPVAHMVTTPWRVCGRLGLPSRIILLHLWPKDGKVSMDVCPQTDDCWILYTLCGLKLQGVSVCQCLKLLPARGCHLCLKMLDKARWNRPEGYQDYEISTYSLRHLWGVFFILSLFQEVQIRFFPCCFFCQ